MAIKKLIQIFSWTAILIGLSLGSIGLTSAYFSDQATSQASFQSGTVELEVSQSTDTATLPLKITNLIPYKKESNFLKVKNVGTLPFNWEMEFQQISSTSSQNLSDVLKVEILTEETLLSSLGQAEEADTEEDYNKALDKFIERVGFLKDQQALSEEIADDLITKALTLKTN